MVERLKSVMNAALLCLAGLGCHRLAYVGLAVSYGALCVGVPKEAVNQAAFAFYVALAAVR